MRNVPDDAVLFCSPPAVGITTPLMLHAGHLGKCIICWCGLPLVWAIGEIDDVQRFLQVWLVIILVHAIARSRDVAFHALL